MEKNGVALGEVGDAGESSVEVDAGDRATLTAILVANGDSRVQVVVSDGEPLSPKKPQLSRTSSSCDQCRFWRFFFSLVSFLWGLEFVN